MSFHTPDEVTEEPIRYVIAGHYHADHIYGLQAFADHTDARIIAQSPALGYLDSETARQRLQQRRDVLFPWVDEDTRVVHPDAFVDDEYRSEVGDKTFRLLHAGPAHAVSFTRGYLSDLREHMGAAVEEFLSFEEAYARADWSKYEGVPASAATHRRNANAVFLEMAAEMFS